MKFNNKRYRQLLIYSQKLKQQKKFIGDVSYSNYRELLSYSGNTELQLELELLDSHLSLIKKFLEGKISNGKLFFEHVKLQNWHEQIHHQLEANLVILSPKQEKTLDHVSNLLNALYWSLEEASLENEEQVFEAVIQSEPYQEALANIKARDLHNYVEKIYLELNNIFKNYRENAKISSNFSELADQLNWENRDYYIELIEAFLADSSNFLQIKQQYESIIKVAKQLDSNSISFKLNYQGFGFSNYLIILIKFFEFYQVDSRISPKVFKSWVEKILFEIKNHYS
jgi:hypothetical protein